MHQCILDCLGALFITLITAVPRVYEGDWNNCVLWETRYPFWIFVNSSTFSLLLITIERYLGIVHPIWYERKITDRHMVFGMSIVWTFGIGTATSMSQSIANIDSDGLCSVHSVSLSYFMRAMGVIWFLVSFLFPILVHVYCYIRMYKTLWIRMASDVDGKDMFDERKDISGENNEDNPTDNRKAMKNVVHTLVTVTHYFVTCWFCNQIYVLFYHFGYPVDFRGNFFHFSF